MQLYGGSDGNVYTESEVAYRFETGAWQPCMWNPDEGWDVVETPADQLVWLIPIDEADLPADVDVQSATDAESVLDTRDS